MEQSSKQSLSESQVGCGTGPATAENLSRYKWNEKSLRNKMTWEGLEMDGIVWTRLCYPGSCL